MDEAGLSTREDWLIAAGYGIENGYTAGEYLLAKNAEKRPTAIFAAHDNIAMGIMASAHRSGITVGKDLALVGYNDTPLLARLPGTPERRSEPASPTVPPRRISPDAGANTLTWRWASNTRRMAAAAPRLAPLSAWALRVPTGILSEVRL
jgi:hypothetical protein